jgi:hypothetical protein
MTDRESEDILKDCKSAITDPLDQAYLILTFHHPSS